MKYLAAIVVVLAVLASPLALAAPAKPAVDSAIAAAIVEKLRAARPDLDYQVLSASPVPGFYQVQVAGGPVLHVREGGEYFFDGALYQARPGEFVNLSELELVGERREAIAAVPVGDTIVFAPAAGKVRGVLNVFTDIDCGYCRKLHQNIPQLNALGIEVRYLAFPRAGVGSESYRKAVAAWCAKDRQGALTRLKNDESIELVQCDDNPVAAQFDLGQEMGVNGTPATVLADGTLVPGYRTPEEFAKILGIAPGAAAR
ncbi:MAG TPA: thioredoxin fold domain-containing protein [Porticoccaceae bacterium]|nr:thioredoxin fold domain-containing protein [Porticoccaceae bacterium]